MDQFERELTGLYPALQRFAYSLAGSQDGADDLVQQTMMKALSARNSFQMGTNMKAWAFTIMRNDHYTERQRRRNRGHLSLDDPENPIQNMWVSGGQFDSVLLKEAFDALETLSPGVQDVLRLVGMEGLQYEEASDRLDVAVGTVKSRLSRGREALARQIAAQKPPREIRPEPHFTLTVRVPREVLAIRPAPVAPKPIVLTPRSPMEVLGSLGATPVLIDARTFVRARVRTFAL